jgi:HK97 family phage portal protein
MLGFLKRMQLSSELKELRMQKEIADLRSTGIQNSTPLSAITQGSSLYDMLSNGVSHAGPVINEQTAMSVGAVYACVRLISGAIAGMPLPIYQSTKDGRDKIDHEYGQLLNRQPIQTMSSAVFWEYVGYSMLLQGDAFAIIRRRGETAVGLEPVHPLRVAVKNYEGSLIYTVFGQAGGAETFNQDDMLHFPGVGFDGLRSMSPIRYAAKQAIGIALAADEYSGRFFSNGARPDIVLEIPGTLTQEQADVIRKSWIDRFGGASNSHAPAIGAGGMKVHEITINAEDAQLIATRQFQVTDIARIYGVPPHMVGETSNSTSWGTGIEQQSIGFVKYTLRPHLNRIEQELNRKLFRSPKVFVEFNVNGLIEGDSKAESEYFGKALGGPGTQGWMSVNEVRRIKNLKPVDGYDQVTRAVSGATGAKN